MGSARPHDQRTFRRACYELARRSDGTVSEFRLAAGVGPNFDQGVITYRDRTVAVVWVRNSMLFAVAQPRVIDTIGARETGPLTFVDEPDLVAILADLPGVRVLTKAELDSAFDATCWPDIAHSDIQYWRPSTVGEALFNYWD